MTTTLSSSTVSQRTCRERSTSRPGRPRAISPVNAYSDLSFASDISAASSSAADSVSSWTQSGSSRSSSPPTDPDEAAEEDSTGKSSALREGVEVAQHLTERESEAIAAIRSRPSPSAADQTAPPFLFLPPLLSRLPISAAPSSSRDRDDVGPALFDSARAASSQSGYAAELDGADSAPVAYTTSHLPTIDPASQALHHALHAFRPVTPRYATSPYADSFNWPDLRLEDDSTGRVKRGAREWYIVAFRSRRNAGLPEDRARELYEADRAAHEEAVTVRSQPLPFAVSRVSHKLTCSPGHLRFPSPHSAAA